MLRLPLSLLALLAVSVPGHALPWSRHSLTQQLALHSPDDSSRLSHPAYGAYLLSQQPTTPHPSPTCVPSYPEWDVTARLQSHLQRPGDVLALCPGQVYRLDWPLNFTAPEQEILTLGLPTDHTRATLVVAGHLSGVNANHSTAIDGRCSSCSHIKIRHIQVDGSRDPDADILPGGGANIALGGSNTGQLVEYTRSFDPRAWSCLHVHEGQHACNNATIVNNDIGPCGFSEYEEWADGISLSCRDSYVAGNLVKDATDGGIVVFGAPGSLIERNTIWAVNRTLLGGINMVDYDPWQGNYTGTIVQHNLIVGGTPGQDPEDPSELEAFVKVGIAVGPRIWFGDKYNDTRYAEGGTVRNNVFTGTFGYGIAISGARHFTVRGNILSPTNNKHNQTRFVGSPGPTCTYELQPRPWVYDALTVSASSVQDEFVDEEADMAICLLKPGDEAVWEEWIWDNEEGDGGLADGVGVLQPLRQSSTVPLELGQGEEHLYHPHHAHTHPAEDDL